MLSLLTDVAITRYGDCVAPLMAATRLMMITGQLVSPSSATSTSCDRWQLLGKYWPLIGLHWSRDLNTGLWLVDNDQVTQITGSYWPLLASDGFCTQLASYWWRLLLVKLASDWLIFIIRGLWLAGADEGTSAILETAACSDRRLCDDCLVLTSSPPFNKFKIYDEDPHINYLDNHKR